MSKPAFAGAGLGVLLATALFMQQRQTQPEIPRGWGDDAARLRHWLTTVAPGPRPAGSEALEVARQRLQVALDAVGVAAHQESRFVCTPLGACGQATNVVARFPGPPGARPLILAAHTDTVAASPGGHDDGLGLATLMEVAARLAQRSTPLSRPVVLLFDDGEEVGLLGAQAFFELHPEEARSAAAFISVDGLGGPTTYRSRGPAQDALTWALGCMPRPYGTSLERLWAPLEGGFDDTHLFADLGVPSVTLAGQEGYAVYHTPLDTPAAVSDATLVDRVVATWAVLRCYLDGEVSVDAATPHDAYGDVLGLVQVRLSPAQVAGLTLATLAACLIGLWRAPRPNRRVWRELVRWAGVAAVAVFGAVVAAGLGAAGLHLAPGRAGALGLVLLGLAVALLARAVASPLVERAGAAPPAAGMEPRYAALSRALVGGTATVGLVLAALAPVAAHVAAVPAALGAFTAALVALPRRTRAAAWPVGGLVTALVLVATAATAGRLAPHGGGLLGLAFVALPLALVAAAAAPTAAAWGLNPGRPTLGAAAAILTVGVLLGISPWRGPLPQGGGLRLVDGPTGQQLQVRGPLAPAWREQLTLRSEPRAYPWSSGDHPVLVATASVSSALAPAVRTMPGPAGRLRLEVASRRRAREFRVAIPPDAPVGAVEVAGRPVPFGPDATRWTRGWRVISVYGARGPWALDLTTTASAAVTLRVADVQSGLPEELSHLVQARPPDLLPAHQGDVHERWVEITLQ